jgi:uncharacterized glyoxalase superfamily protein PhnB
MSIKDVTPILNVSDVPTSIAWFESVGWKRAFCWNPSGPIAGGADRNEHGPADFAGVCTEGAQIFLCKDAQGSREKRAPDHACDDNTGAVWMSWWLESRTEVDEMYQLALKLKYEIARPPFDAPWGVREFHLRHPDGHTFRVGADLECAESAAGE